MRRFRRVVEFAVLAILSNIVACSSDASPTEIQNLVSTVVVDLGSSNLKVGQTVQAAAIARGTSGGTLTGTTVAWTSSNTDVATVSPAGLVTAVGPGEADIVASAAGHTGKVTVIVAAIPVTSVTVALSDSVAHIGETPTATATTRDVDDNVLTDRAVEWSSSHPEVAVVSPTGAITTVGVGTTDIIALSEHVTGTAALTVQVSVSAVSLTIEAIQLRPGQITTATATLTDAAHNVLSGRPITWLSSDASVATVTETGVVTAVTPGFAAITATSEEVIGTAAVGVEGPPATVDVTLGSNTLLLGNTTMATAIVRDAGNLELADRTVTWSSSDPIVATIDANGAISANVTGVTTITGTDGDASGTAIVGVIGGAAGGGGGGGGGGGSTPATQLAVTTQPGGAVTGATITPAPVVEVKDPSGSLVAGATTTITATLASGNGTLSGTMTVTAVGGVATFSNLRVTGFGAHTLQFSGAGLASATSSSFVVSAAPATQMAIATQPSSTAQSGVAFAPQPVIQLRDASNNPVSQGGVVVTAAIASGGGTLGGTTSVVTNGSGRATFTSLMISGAVGSRTLVFTSTGLSTPASSSIAVSAATESRLSIVAQPSSSASSGAAFDRQPVVQLRDASNNVVAQSGVAVSVAIASGSGTLGGTTSATTNASGVATFAGLSIAGSGVHTLRFSGSGLTSVTSATVTIGAGAPAALSITTQPSSSAPSGVAFGRQPVVQIRDGANNAVSQTGVAVTASIASGGGTLGGTATATTNASGVATFSGLSITGTAGNRTLRFNAPSLNGATSSAIAIGTTSADAESPAVDITDPTSSTTYATTATTMTVSGTASDNVGVTQVTWTNDRGGSGTASGTTSWAVTGVALQTGTNVLTVTARDAAGNVGAATLTVTKTVVGSVAPVASYGFNEAAGTAAADRSGNNNTGHLGSGVAWSGAGKYGSALVFDGSGFVSVPDAASLDLTAGMTVEAWVYPTAEFTAYSTVAMKEQAGAYAYSLYASAPANPSGEINVTTVQSGQRAAPATSAIELNAWTHLAATYDGTRIRLYKNGSLVSLRTATGAISTSSGALRIGGNALWGEFFKGLIDEVRIYDHALNSTDIRTDMATPIGGSALADATPPSVDITGPTASSTYATTSSPISLSGTASDNVGVTQVTWANSRGGSGTASGTTTWSASGVALQTGSNVLTVTARDAANNVATTTLTVAMSAASAPTPTQLTILSQPNSAQSGSAIGQVVVQLRDASNAPINQSGVDVTVTKASGSASLGGTTSATTNPGGIALFHNLVLTGSGTQTLRFAASGFAAATSSSISLSSASNGGGGSPAANILNASFESGWDGFTDWTGAAAPKSVARDNSTAADGSWSIVRSWTPNPSNDGGSQFLYKFGATDRVWVRFYFKLTAPITTVMKFARFYDPTFSQALGGFFLGAGNDIFTFGTDKENGAITTSLGLTQNQVIDGGWHSLEIDYWRSGDPSGYPSAAFYFDGVQMSRPDGNDVKYACPGAGTCNKSRWSGGRLISGERMADGQVGYMEWLATLNAGNTTTGQVNIDRIAISTVGRIGP